jgi:hypothetical protein
MTDGERPPRWEVVTDAGSPVRSKVLAQLAEDRTSGRFPLAIHPGEEMTNGEIRPGRVGLWTKAGSVTYFDAFEISPR